MWYALHQLASGATAWSKVRVIRVPCAVRTVFTWSASPLIMVSPRPPRRLRWLAEESPDQRPVSLIVAVTVATADESLDGDRAGRIPAAAMLDRVGHRLPGGQQDVGSRGRVHARCRSANRAAGAGLPGYAPVRPAARWRNCAADAVVGTHRQQDDVIGVAAGRGHPVEQLVTEIPDRQVGTICRPRPAAARILDRVSRPAARSGRRCRAGPGCPPAIPVVPYCVLRRASDAATGGRRPDCRKTGGRSGVTSNG